MSDDHLMTGLSNDCTNICFTSNETGSDLTICLHDNENNRKFYPQRPNRSKLNYRNLQRGMYEDIRQSMWAFSISPYKNKRQYDGEIEIIDLSVDDDDDNDHCSIITDKSMNDNEQTYRRLWCLCKQSWDHSRIMLRCDSCSDWYHSDCIGMSKEQAKQIESNGSQFTCPLCHGTIELPTKSIEDESPPAKRKRSDPILTIRTNSLSPKHSESTNKSPPQAQSSTESKTDGCIAPNCSKLAKFDWVYCSLSCIRRHINHTLYLIQKTKKLKTVDQPTIDDIILFESKTKTYLDRSLLPKINDLNTWIQQHPSYELLKPSSKHFLQSKIQQKKSQSSSSSSSLPKKNSQTSTNTEDARTKVPKDLYDKILMRLEKNNEKNFLKNDILIRVNEIEAEMFRIYGKIDTAYKNKYRSLLSNISNMKNNFFYKEIFSKNLTAQDIVAMKPEDMLPPEEKEKRQVEFEKQIQRIHEDGYQQAEALERLKRTKLTRQGLIDNDAYETSIFNSNEDDHLLPEPIPNENLPPKQQIDSIDDSNPIVSSNDDIDNDYIEPESPTGADALIYDEEENNNNNQSQSSNDSQEIIFLEETTRRDGNLPFHHWSGIIYPSHMKLSCQSIHVYGESTYLLEHIPTHLHIKARLQTSELWKYIQESLPIRDILILTLTSSYSHEKQIFSQYVDSILKNNRANVIEKSSTIPSIRNIYILAADIKDCPANVLSTFFLPITFESKQLFLIIISSGRKTLKSINSIQYNPIALQISSINKDPRLNKINNHEYLKMISNSFERIRHSSTIDEIHAIQNSTLEYLKMNQREDLIDNYNIELTRIISEWKNRTNRDNFTEENMDVDNSQQEHPKIKRKSRFSDISSEDINCMHSNMFIEKNFSREDKSLKKDFNDNFLLKSTKHFSSFHRKQNYEKSSKNFEDLVKQIHTYSYQGLTFANENWIKSNLPINALRSTAMLNLIFQQQQKKTSQSKYEWKSNHHHHHYHDFDRPDE